MVTRISVLTVIMYSHAASHKGKFMAALASQLDYVRSELALIGGLIAFFGFMILRKIK